MTSLLISILLLVGVSLIGAHFAAEPPDRSFLYRLVVAAWCVLMPLTAIVNYWMPFSSGGDDESYYFLASLPVYSFWDLLDTKRFVGLMEQPGYPMALSFINFIVGSNLLVFKLFNLAVLVFLGLVWYRIGVVLEDRGFGKMASVVVMTLTPLWFYIFILRKDLLIALIQSVFLYGAIGAQDKPGVLRYWLYMVCSTLAVILFRTPLVLVHLAVLWCAYIFRQWAAEQSKAKTLLLSLVGLAFAAVFLLIGTNPEAMERFGIYTEHRILLSQQMKEQVYRTAEASEMNRPLFPLLYLLSETSGLNPLTWGNLDDSWLRGALAMPWIACVVPFFFYGLLRLSRLPANPACLKQGFVPLIHSRAVYGRWLPLLLFITAYFAISWQVGDTTRWRLPDMPAIATVALAGFMFSNPTLRYRLFFMWIGAAFFLFGLYYLMRGF